MRRLARQLGQAAQTAANYHDDNPHSNLNRSVKATTERATRRFIRREIKPLLIKKQLKAENDRLNEAMNMRNSGGCFDTRGNKINCPLSYRSYEAITSVKRAIFNDFGQFVREEDSNSFSMGSLLQSHSLMYQKTAPMMQTLDPNRPNTEPIIHRFANSSNFIISLVYNIANDAFQVIQILDFDLIPGKINPLTGKRTNINIDGTANYKPINGYVNTLTSAVPTFRGAKMVTKAMPKGLGYVNKLNASAFSSKFKGNLSKLRPKLRGYSNRLMNKAIESYNGQVSDGMILLKVGNLKLNNDNN